MAERALSEEPDGAGEDEEAHGPDANALYDTLARDEVFGTVEHQFMIFPRHG